KNDIYGQLDDITKQVKTLMDTLEQESRKRGYTVVADAYKRCVEQLDDFFKKADGPISKVLSDFDDRLKMILPEAPLVTSGTSFSISAGTAQGGSKAEVIKTRNRTKKKTNKCPLCNKKIGKGKKECEGAKFGSTRKAEFGRADGSQWAQLKNRNSWETRAFHPWFYESNSVQAHHLIPINAFKIKRHQDGKVMTDKKIMLRRMGQYCGYDINHPNNSVVLPSTIEAACFLKKPRHSGGHDRNEFNYTNECSKLTCGRLNSALQEKKKSGSCSKITNTTLLTEFNESSADIFALIDAFRWFITKDGQNYDPRRQPYAGCDVSCKHDHVLIHVITKKQIINYKLEIGQ
ncbi:AHH domain-containing protein, partial [Vibrio owensii]